MKKILLLLLSFMFFGCSTYKISTLGHDPIYSIEGSDVEVRMVKNEFELSRLLRKDSQFRYDFAQYAMNQDLRWHYDFYFNNRMYRSAFSSPFNFYWNSNQYWWNWASNYPFNYGFNPWDRFGFYGNYGYNSWNNWGSYGYGWNHWGWRQQMNGYAWQHRNRPNTAYINGRRGSTMSIRDRIGQGAMIESSKRENRVIEEEKIVLLANKLRKRVNNKNIRVYNNPNNPNLNNNKPVRNYNRPPVNNNPPPRIYNRPPVNNNNNSSRSKVNIVKSSSNSRGGNSNIKN